MITPQPGERTQRIRPSGAAADPGEVTARLTPPPVDQRRPPATIRSAASAGDAPAITRSEPSAGDGSTLPVITRVGPAAGDRAAVYEEPSGERPRDDDEPTVERPDPAIDLDGPTRRLRADALTPPVAGTDAEPEPDPADGAGAEPGRSADRVTAREAAGDPDAVVARPGRVREEDLEGGAAEFAAGSVRGAPWRRLSSAGALIWVLLALFGFTLVVQLRSNDGDQGLATARQEDLVRILSDLDARDSRLQTEITALESSQRQLTSGVTARQAALDEATKRADELGLLAGTLPGRGPGLKIVVDKVKASAILNAVQELRGAGGEVMEVAGTGGGTVRIVASSYFVDAEGGGIIVDGAGLTGPYTLWVIGSPQTMQTALQIPGGVVASVNSGGGSVTTETQDMVEVTAVRKATTLQYARPVS